MSDLLGDASTFPGKVPPMSLPHVLFPYASKDEAALVAEEDAKRSADGPLPRKAASQRITFQTPVQMCNPFCNMTGCNANCQI